MDTPILPPAQSIFVLTVVALVVLAFVCMLVLKLAVHAAEKRAGVEYRWEAPEPAEPGPIRKWIEAHAAKQEARYTPRRYVVMSYKPGEGVVSSEVQNWGKNTEPNRTNEPQNPPNLALQSGSLLGTGAFALNPQEAAAVARMIDHKASADKPTKASIIWAGFGIKKGDSTKYKRASEIYDALFVAQPDFPALEATRQPKWGADQAPAH